MVIKVGFDEKIKLDENNNPVIDKNGKVMKSGWGNYVTIQHYDENGNPNYQSRYGHLAQKPNLEKGQILKEGEVFGIMGATGGAKGAHLHYEVLKPGPKTGSWIQINPETVNVGKYNTRDEIPK